MTFEEVIIDAFTLLASIAFLAAWRREYKSIIMNVFFKIVTVYILGHMILSHVDILESYTVILKTKSGYRSSISKAQICIRYIIILLLSTMMLFLISKVIIDKKIKN